MDSHGPTAPGAAAFYFSVSFERNSKGVNVGAKACSWYTAAEGESPGNAAENALAVQANATSIAMLAAKAVERKIELGFDDAQVRAFIEHAEAFAERMAKVPLP